MAKRDHYLGTDIRKSTRTKLVQTIGEVAIYSHTIRNIAGTHIVVLGDDWEAADTIQAAERLAVGVTR